MSRCLSVSDVRPYSPRLLALTTRLSAIERCSVAVRRPAQFLASFWCAAPDLTRIRYEGREEQD